MVVLLLLSLMAIYIFVQRLIIIRRAGKEDETFMNRIKDYIHEGKVDSALNLCRSTNTPSARMIEKGITRLGRPMNDVLVAIENVVWYVLSSIWQTQAPMLMSPYYPVVSMRPW